MVKVGGLQLGSSKSTELRAEGKGAMFGSKREEKVADLASHFRFCY
jgi:hypothetical protein